VRICQDLRRLLDRIRALGLAAPAQPAAGLGPDFMLTTGDVPKAPEPPEPSRDLPAEIMRALTARLADLERGSCGPEIRTGIELLMDTGRRPDEICQLPFDCLALDADSSPVLVYDNHKGARNGRRLPIGQATANVITGQQQRVRARFPAVPAARLALLPTVIGNPDGARPVSVQSLIQRHRDWIGRMPALALADGSEFAKDKIVPYCYRHTYAQRHADAGIAPDVLRDLMNHRSINATLRYYRVGEGRRRDAVDKVTAAVRPARQPDLAGRAHAAGCRARPVRDRRGRRSLRPVHRAIQRRRWRRGMPDPLPLRGLRPLPHRRLLPPRPHCLPR